MFNPWKQNKKLLVNKNVLEKNIEDLQNAIEIYKSKLKKRDEVIDILKKEVSSLNEKVGNPAEVIKKLLGRPLKWRDISKMSPEVYSEYYKEAQNLLENEVFISELEHFEYDIVQDIAKNSEDFQQVLNRRFTYNGLLAFKQRIEDLPKIKDEEEKSEEDYYEAI